MTYDDAVKAEKEVKLIVEQFIKEYRERMIELEKKYNINIVHGNITYDATGFRFKSECSIVGRKVELSNSAEIKIGDTIRLHNGISAVIVNINARARKNPYQAKTEDGRMIAFGDDYFRMCMVRRWHGTELPKQIEEKLGSLCCQLSPENLTCDGELTKWEIRKREQNILKQWYHIEKEVGFQIDPTEFEVYYYTKLEARHNKQANRDKEMEL